MKFYLLVGRLGDIYGFTPSEELARQFKLQKPGRRVGVWELAELDSEDSSPAPSTPTAPGKKKHVFFPDEERCMFCPCLKTDPDAGGICEKAPPSAPDYEE